MAKEIPITHARHAITSLPDMLAKEPGAVSVTRIIYRAEKERAQVSVVVLVIRKGGEKQDMYELAKKLIKAGLLEI
jgi:hypothetical protein